MPCFQAANPMNSIVGTTDVYQLSFVVTGQLCVTAVRTRLAAVSVA